MPPKMKRKTPQDSGREHKDNMHEKKDCPLTETAHFHSDISNV
jgi:hypothetical protein